MAASLTKLKGFIQTYLGYNFDNLSDIEFAEIRNFVGQAVLELRWEMEDDLNALQDEPAKSKCIYYLQSQLTYLADSVSGFGRENREQIEVTSIFKWLQNCIYNLLEHIRIYYTSYFDFDADLPAEFVEALKPTYNFFNSLKENIDRANIDPDLSVLLINFSETSNSSERFKIRTWRQWDFVIKTASIIDHFLTDLPEGEINLELLKLFVCRDFNSIQIYAYFLKFIERAMANDASFPEQKQELLYLLKVFKQVRVENRHGYDPNVQQLKTSVLESLKAEIAFLEEKNQLFIQNFRLTNPASPTKFYFAVAATLAELMFFFRLMLEVGFIQTKFNSFLYEFISNHIRTKKAENISKKSMRNHFNNKPFPDRVVRNVRLWLTKMIGHLDLYYKVNL